MSLIHHIYQISISDGDNYSYAFKYLKIYYACGCMSIRDIANYLLYNLLIGNTVYFHPKIKLASILVIESNLKTFKLSLIFINTSQLI